MEGEILTMAAARQHTHLSPVAAHIPELDPNVQILLLLGRDILRVHRVRQQINGPDNIDFAQRLDIGWVLIADVCLGDVQRVNMFPSPTSVSPDKAIEDKLGSSVFEVTTNDVCPPSFEDRAFLKAKKSSMKMKLKAGWYLYLAEPPETLSSCLFTAHLRQKAWYERAVHYLLMGKVFDNNHAE